MQPSKLLKFLFQAIKTILTETNEKKVLNASDALYVLTAFELKANADLIIDLFLLLSLHTANA